MRCRHRGHPASLVKELVFTFLNGIVEHNQNMKTEGDFSGAQFLQVKRLFSGFNRTAIRHISRHNLKVLHYQHYAYFSAAHSEGGAVTPLQKAWLDFRRQRRWTDGWVRETNTNWACMLKGKCVHSYCIPSCVLLSGFTAVCSM